MKSPLTAAQTAVLAELVRRSADRKLVLVGAAALGCHIPMTWRRTHDIDIVVLSDFQSASALLLATGLEQDARVEHRWWRREAGVQLDVLPATIRDLAAGHLVWKSGHVMSLQGLELAFTHSQPLELAPGVAIAVATLPVIVVLKMVAWLDSPHERSRDLEDIGYALSEYLAADDDRHWEDPRLTTEQFDEHSAFALGCDIRAIVTNEHAKHIEHFLERVGDPESWAFSKLSSTGTSGGRDRADAFAQRLESFRRAFAVPD